MRFRTLRPIVLAAALAATAAMPALAQDGMAGAQEPPATQPGTRPTTQGGRTLEQIGADLQRVQMTLAETMSDPSVLTNPETRDKAAPVAVPALKEIAALMGEASSVTQNPMEAQQLKTGRYQVEAILVGFSDEATEQRLAADEAIDAKAALALGHFIGGDDDEQKTAAINELATLAAANPEHPAVAQTAWGLVTLTDRNETLGPPARAIVNETLKGPISEQLRRMLGQMEQQLQAEKDFEARFIGKPLAIEGQTLAGSPLSTAALKGKVVLVHFWAVSLNGTQVEPASTALVARLKEDYQQHHDQGLEIVGIVLDRSAARLKEFLAANPEVTWPQIYTEADPTASAKIADTLGIQAVPAVFLLDKSGIVRAMAVGGGDQMDKLHKMIPELLEEPSTQPAE